MQITPTGQRRWKNISKAITGELTPQQAMDKLAKEQDAHMATLKMAAYSPVLNPEKSREEWLQGHPPDVSPKPPRPRPKPITIPYEDLIQQWKVQRSDPTGFLPCS